MAPRYQQHNDWEFPEERYQGYNPEACDCTGYCNGSCHVDYEEEDALEDEDTLED